MKLNQVIKDMKATYQIKDQQTILQHGLMVYSYAYDLIKVLKGEKSKYNQKLPAWMIENSIFILSNILDIKSIKHYCIWHDLGKPHCAPDR